MKISYLLNVPGVSAGQEHAFAQSDPYGAMMALMGMGIVFIALLMLYVIFRHTPVLYTQSFRNKLKEVFSFRKKEAAEKVMVTAKPDDLSGEVNAAIAAAIYLYRSEMHDFEDTVLTIKKVSRTYSPWSSKIYGLRNVFYKN